VGAGLAVDRDIQHILSRLPKRRPSAAGEDHQLHPNPRQHRQQADQLFALAGVRESDQDIAFGEQAEIAVQGFGGVQKVRGRSGGPQRGGDLACDEAALADAGDDHALSGGCGRRQQRRGVVEGGAGGAVGVVQALSKLLQRGCLDADELGGSRRFRLSWHVHRTR
jgi:hypothetical protein